MHCLNVSTVQVIFYEHVPESGANMLEVWVCVWPNTEVVCDCWGCGWPNSVGAVLWAPNPPNDGLVCPNALEVLAPNNPPVAGAGACCGCWLNNPVEGVDGKPAQYSQLQVCKQSQQCRKWKRRFKLPNPGWAGCWPNVVALLAAPKRPVAAGCAFWPNRDAPVVVPNAGVLKPVVGFPNEDCPKGVGAFGLVNPPTTKKTVYHTCDN